ncbi:type VII secretion integral membrane protein EccD [Schumannella luteola]|uniref:Type VII secretion integral membrane protein EccD n=1 Tax=Schumannella luteola TaxID=472059 RepID=A0A852Y7T8_9MICO|nr:type VII secretion integral membrane protein EccD [Schumannella luteola]NYG97942.1 type VII secretion integral membrane protein EccD [Schumannella luteola]TPX03076.1 type VII secretion integral membrane protein EccD [Schumannella luteola]
MTSLDQRTESGRPAGQGRAPIGQSPAVAGQAVQSQAAPSAGRAVEPAVAAGAGAGDMCRLSVVGPTSRVELAVPSHIPIVELLPTIVGHLDPMLATRGLDHGGWVLQRLGHPPLDEDRGTAAAGLLDGDVLYLRPRTAVLAQAQYDDLVDGVQLVLDARDDSWNPVWTRRAALAAATLACLVSIAVAGTTGTAAPIVAGALALVLLAAGALIGRLWDDVIGSLLIGTGVVGAALAGATTPAALFPGGGATPLAAATAGAAATGIAAGAAAYARGGVRPRLLATTGAAIIVVLGLTVPLVLRLGLPQGAAIVVLLALAVARALPVLAAWIGGLSVDPVPLSSKEFQTGLDAVPADEVERKATVAHQTATALWAAWAVVLCAAISVLALDPGWASTALVVAGSVGVLLQARELHAAVQRGAVIVAAAVPLVVLALAHASRLDTVWQIVIAAALVIVAANACVAALLLPRGRLAPTWGRAGDVLHWVCAIAIPALVLAVVGLYDWIADLV